MGSKKQVACLPGPVRALIVTVAGALLLLASAAPARGQPDPHLEEGTGDAGGIANIGDFLQQCPTNDPRYAQFRADFEIRKEGAVVGAIPCMEPISALPVAQYTDELIAVQTLRTIYYMEGGRDVPYPWTAGSFYDWMKSKIGGIDIRANNSHCCEFFNGRWFIVLSSQGDFERDRARRWTGISARITLAGHETRHVDGFPHVGGCPLFPAATYGCDQTYDERSLSPYGIQWWFNAMWLSGALNVGYSCLPENVVADIANGHLNSDNNDFGRRFVDNRPPILTMPDQPGGACPTSSATPTLAPTPTTTPTQTPTPTPTTKPTQTPTPIPTPTPVPTPAPTPQPTVTAAPLIQGDVDCTGAVSAADALAELRFVAGLPPQPAASCPALGSGEPFPWGDVDCGGGVNSADALKTLRYIAGLPVDQLEPCPDVGSSYP